MTFETYIRTNNIYHFVGHYEKQETNKNQIVIFIKENKTSEFYVVYYLNTKETEFYKYLKHNII
jgi:hypothetical protein